MPASAHGHPADASLLKFIFRCSVVLKSGWRGAVAFPMIGSASGLGGSPHACDCAMIDCSCLEVVCLLAFCSSPRFAAVRSIRPLFLLLSLHSAMSAPPAVAASSESSASAAASAAAACSSSSSSTAGAASAESSRKPPRQFQDGPGPDDAERDACMDRDTSASVNNQQTEAEPVAAGSPPTLYRHALESVFAFLDKSVRVYTRVSRWEMI